jgi:hypothetical protein
MAKRKTKVNKAHYVDNAKFLEEMVEYKRDYNAAVKNGEDPPVVSEYLGSVFLKIAQRLSFRPNFINYTFKNDMISDGIENCLHYIHYFNPEKSNNPFAYFTQIIYYAFIRRIQKEKKQTLIKQKLIMKAGDDGAFTNQYTDFMQRNMVVDVEEKPKVRKKKKKEPRKLEYFMQ